MGRIAEPLHDRFMRFVDQSHPSGCWLWMGACFTNGYGAFRVGNQQQRAHRVAFALFKGNIPKGAVVCHSCDVRRCVNPEHLWPGTQKENQEDMTRKGRGRYGAMNGARIHPPKLSLRDVEAIRRLRGVYPQTQIASMYGISQKMVSLIHAGKRWDLGTHGL